MRHPRYDIVDDCKGRLVEQFSFITPLTGYEHESRLIELDRSGLLTIKEGFTWDFGSGPAIDTPDMVYGSLAHDALYRLMILKVIPWNQRRKIDRYFQCLLKEAGMGWMRRQWVYAGVRVGYPLTKLFPGLV